MAINFPSSPSINDTFIAGSITYKWDGAKWIGLGVTPTDRLIEGSNKLEIDASNNLIWTGNNVGIQNVSPDEALEVGAGTVDGGLKVSGQSSNVTSDGLTVDWESSSNSTRIFSEPSSGGSSAIRFFTTSSGTRSERLRITSDGDLGLGVSDGFSGSAGSLYIVGGQGVRWTHPTDGSFYGDYYVSSGGNHIFRTGSSLNEKFRISSGGLITGSRSSTTAYDAAATTNDTGFLLLNNGAAGHATLQLQIVSGGSANTGQATISAFTESTSTKATALSFGTRQNSDATVRERLRIGSTGIQQAFVRSQANGYQITQYEGPSSTRINSVRGYGKIIDRGTSERNIDVAQAYDDTLNASNINVLITVTFKLNAAVSANAGTVTFTAGFYGFSGPSSYTYWTNAPTITNHLGSTFGAGSIAWVGGGNFTKGLRYTTDANTNYVSYYLSEIIATGNDSCPVSLL